MQQLLLQGFKGFRAPTTIPIRPITLIYGTNSSGKSSIIQSLVLLKQTTEEINDSPSALAFTSERLLDLGGYLNIISGHDSKTKLKYIFEPLATRKPRTSSRPDKQQIGFTYGNDGRDGAKLLAIELYLDSNTKPTYTFRPTRKQKAGTPQDLGNDSTLSTFHLTTINRSSQYVAYQYQRFMKMRNKLREFFSTYPSPDDNPRLIAMLKLLQDDNITIAAFVTGAIAYAQSRPFLFQPSAFRVMAWDHNRSPKELFQWLMQQPMETRQRHKHANVFADMGIFGDILDVGFQELRDVTASLRREIKSISYIGPLRQFPRRTYAYSRATPNDVGFSGQHFPNLIYSSDGDLLDQLNALSSRMQLGYKIKVLKPKDKTFNKTFAISLTDETTGVEVGIADVGFGVSQVLPILLQCVLGATGITIIEQPEIHLNPRLQAELGSILATAVASKSSRDTPRATFIVETHSEHMLLRIGNCVKRGLLAPSDISVIFVSKGPDGSTVHAIEIDDLGRMAEPWPDDNFFDDTFLERFSDARDNA